MTQFKLRSIFALVSAISVLLALSLQLPAIAVGYGEMLIIGTGALILFGDRLPQIGRAVERSWDEDPIGHLLLVNFGITIFLFIVTLCWTFGR